MTTPPSSASILARLETPQTLTNLYCDVSAFLLPFADLVALDSHNPNPRRKPTRKKKARGDGANTRALAKEFFPFISQLLKLLPPVLRDRAKEREDGGRDDNDGVLEIFGVYRLALDCLTCLVPCLVGKPYWTHLQRFRLVACLEQFGKYSEAESEVLALLESLVSVVNCDAPVARRVGKGKGGRKCSSFLPVVPVECDGCGDLAVLVVEVAVSLICCAYKSKTKDRRAYERAIALVEEVHLWFKVLNERQHDKYKMVVVNDLYKCSLFLAGNAIYFDSDLLQRFCTMTLQEWAETSLMDQSPKIARRIYHEFDLKWQDRHLILLGFLKFISGLLQCKCKKDMTHCVNSLIEFICYCTEECYDANVDACRSAFKLLSEGGCGLALVLPAIASILHLCAAGLYISVSSKIPSCELQFPEEAALCSHLGIDDSNNLSTDQESKYNTDCKEKHGKLSIFSYLAALRVACNSFVDYVNADWKQLLCQGKTIESPNIAYIQDALHQFCDLYFMVDRCTTTSEKERDRLNESRALLLHSAVTVFRLSLCTSRKQQDIIKIISKIITSEWIEPNELKFLVSSLYNIGALLYNSKQMEQASVVLGLSCTAAWAHVKRVCCARASEDTIKNAVADAISRSAMALDTLRQCDSTNMHNLVVNYLINWAAAYDTAKSLTGPVKLIKPWVKKIFKDFEDVSSVEDVPLIYSSLLTHDITISEKAMGIILEQELLAYEELSARNSKLCRGMQLRIVDVLLVNLYTTKEYIPQRAKILVIKGKALREAGIEGLNSCSRSLSEAISLLKGISDKSSETNTLDHQLAVAYCLHAQCAQEINQDAQIILHDIRSALDLLSKLDFTSLVDDQFEMISVNTAQLLCTIADLMSLKGFLGLQTEIHKFIILFCKLKNVPVEKCIAMLWRDRRLSHVCCPLPIDPDFIKSTTQHFDIHANSFDIWLSCLKDMPSSVLGFLQKFSLSDSIIPQLKAYSSQRPFSCSVSIDEVVVVACSLITEVPVTNYSAFAAAYLYHDISERLSSEGRFFEALRYAREAFKLRQKLLQRKFVYSSKEHPALGNKPCQASQDNSSHAHLEVVAHAITETWPNSGTSQDLEGSIINPWNVIRCYLESLLQVGVIHETLGDGLEAERHFLTGKTVSTLQDLKLCEAMFSSLLGQVYCRKQLYELAEKELHGAKNVLQENDETILCKFCKLTLAVEIDMQIGDLYRSLSESALRTPSTGNIPSALDLYNSSFKKLTDLNLECSIIISKQLEVDDVAQTVAQNGSIFSAKVLCSRCSRSNFCLDDSHIGPRQSNVTVISQSNSKLKGPNMGKASKRRGKTSSKSACLHKSLSFKGTSDNPFEKDSFSGNNCWTCFLIRVVVTGSVQDVIHQKWECHRRRLLLKLLSRLWRCTDWRGIHEVHKWFLCSMAILFARDPYCEKKIMSLSCASIPEFIDEDRPGDSFSIERAVVLYDMSLFFAKSCLSESPQTKCCSLSSIQLPTVISWLLRAFMLVHEFPALFRKISRLIATLFLLSTLSGNYAIPCDLQKSLTIGHWATYFHQASIGDLHHRHLSTDGETFKDVDESSLSSGTANNMTYTSTSLSFVPESLSQLEEHVRNFFMSFPNMTVVCISFLDGDYINILEEALLLPSFFPSWLLLSRLNSSGHPITMLLPVKLISEESLDGDANSFKGCSPEGKEAVTPWECPWGHTIVDYVAPPFKSILEENYLSLSSISAETADTPENRSRWWSKRMKLNNKLSGFLRKIEDMWFGPWRCLLLGERFDDGCLTNFLDKIVRELKSNSGFNVNEGLLKTILGGAGSFCDANACLRQLVLYGGYFGHGEGCGEGNFRIFSNSSTGSNDAVQSLRDVIQKAMGEVAAEATDREPVTLVLDTDIQMLPWENIPVLRGQEVYRMPSVSSISLTLRGRDCNRKEAMTVNSLFPFIDPLNAYYLLNPSGDLCRTQVEFEEWFRNQNLQGKAGIAPTTEELIAALQNYDLFIYLGHGNGTQYIPAREIQKLGKCGAVLLMGCSSGSLSLLGCYAPQGASLSYLRAGSPAVIANLWDVSDKDIDRFAKTVLDSWLREDYFTCHSKMVKEFKHMRINNVNHTKSLKTRSMVCRGKKGKESTGCDCRHCSLTKWITSSMSEARDACKLPFLIGASPVCYGVPTIIRRKSGAI